MKLEVGCGNFPLGDINTDISRKDIGHRTGRANNLLETLNNKIKNLVICDGCHLPFRDNIFEEVLSNHVIEHTKNPFLFLKETVRVSKNRIHIKCPHGLGDRLIFWNLSDFHYHFFKKKWFLKAGKKLDCYTKVNYSRFVLFPFINFIPYELEINLVKK